MTRHRGVIALTAVGVGLGDGIVGRVGIVDKSSMVHTIYRLSTLTLGAVGVATGWNDDVSDSLIASSLALLASRVPAALDGGGFQQFGLVRGVSPAAEPPRIR